jgi:hypothetical protein
MVRRRSGRRVDATGRSKRGGQFVPISYDMAVSIAWLSLSGAAIKVYVELRRLYNGGNNGELSLSLDEAARLLHLDKATVARALAELGAKGFIRMTARGAAVRLLDRNGVAGLRLPFGGEGVVHGDIELARGIVGYVQQLLIVGEGRRYESAERDNAGGHQSYRLELHVFNLQLVA